MAGESDMLDLFLVVTNIALMSQCKSVSPLCKTLKGSMNSDWLDYEPIRNYRTNPESMFRIRTETSSISPMSFSAYSKVSNVLTLKLANIRIHLVDF